MKRSEKKWMSLMKKLNLILSNLIFIFLFSISLHIVMRKILLGKAIVLDGDTIKIKGIKIRFTWYRCTRKLL